MYFKWLLLDQKQIGVSSGLTEEVVHRVFGTGVLAVLDNWHLADRCLKQKLQQSQVRDATEFVVMFYKLLCDAESAEAFASGANTIESALKRAGPGGHAAAEYMRNYIFPLESRYVLLTQNLLI